MVEVFPVWLHDLDVSPRARRQNVLQAAPLKLAGQQIQTRKPVHSTDSPFLSRAAGSVALGSDPEPSFSVCRHHALIDHR